jgi:hypothetical protein
MPVVAIKTEYAREADELAARLKEHGVILTRNSEKLLRITVQGWYEEPPEFIDREEVNEEKLRSLLSAIIDQAAEEEHVVAKKRKGKPVAFTDLFAGVFKGGQWVLGNIVHKGFSSEEV